MSLACLYMAMTPEEVLNAVDNAAYSLGESERIGSLEAGKQADIVIFQVDDYRKIPYYIGTNLVETVIKTGKVVVSR